MSRSRRSHGVCLAPMTFKPKDSHMLWWRWGSKKSKPWTTSLLKLALGDTQNWYWFCYLSGISYDYLTPTCQRVALQSRGHTLSGSRSLYSILTLAVKFLPHSHSDCKDSHRLWWRWVSKKVSLERLNCWTSWRRMFIGFATKTYLCLLDINLLTYCAAI